MNANATLEKITAKRNEKNKLELWEMAIINAVLAKGTFENDQYIIAYFTRLTRSINHRAIVEIRTATKHARINAASEESLAQFINNWPQVDPETCLHVRGDELLMEIMRRCSARTPVPWPSVVLGRPPPVNNVRVAVNRNDR